MPATTAVTRSPPSTAALALRNRRSPTIANPPVQKTSAAAVPSQGPRDSVSTMMTRVNALTPAIPITRRGLLRRQTSNTVALNISGTACRSIEPRKIGFISVPTSRPGYSLPQWNGSNPAPCNAAKHASRKVTAITTPTKRQSCSGRCRRSATARSRTTTDAMLISDCPSSPKSTPHSATHGTADVAVDNPAQTRNATPKTAPQRSGFSWSQARTRWTGGPSTTVRGTTPSARGRTSRPRGCHRPPSARSRPWADRRTRTTTPAKKPEAPPGSPRAKGPR